MEKDKIIKVLTGTADHSYVPIELVVSLFDVLSKCEHVRVIDVGRRTGIARSALKLMVEYLSNYIHKENDAYRLSESGHEFILRLNQYRTERENEIEVGESKAISSLGRIEALRNRANRNIDQFPATPETSIRRALLMEQHFSLTGRRVVFMGDNDLTSIAIGLIGSAEQLTVLDIDTQVLSLIEEIAKDHHLPLECHEYDARNPLPESLRGRFDVVVTDPPYTRAGISLFLSRGAEMLGNPNGCAYLSYGSSLRSREREVYVQQIVGDLGWLIYGFWPRFNEYYSAGSIGSRSNLYRLLSTPKTRSVTRGYFSDSLYTGQTTRRRNKNRSSNGA